MGLRLRFELIDRVLERGEERVVTLKNVTSAEEYLGDHFPGFPVLPGVMMLEALVQAGRLLVEGRADSGGPGGSGVPWPLVVAEVRNVRYAAMVRPGQTLRVEVDLRGHDDRGWDMNGVGSVEGQVAVQGRFRLAELPPAPNAGPASRAS